MSDFAVCTSDTRRSSNPLMRSLVSRPPLHISSWGGVDTSASYSSLVLRAIQDKLDSSVDEILPETQQPPTQSNLYSEEHHLAAKNPSHPVSVGAFKPFREKHWDKIRALKVQKNLQISHEARQQLENMLSGGADGRFIVPKILSGLNRTQMVLLSCATVVGGQDFFALAQCRKSRNWRDEEKTCFCLKFTSFVPGPWYMKDILDVWEELLNILSDNIRIWRYNELLSRKTDHPFWAQ